MTENNRKFLINNKMIIQEIFSEWIQKEIESLFIEKNRDERIHQIDFIIFLKDKTQEIEKLNKKPEIINKETFI